MAKRLIALYASIPLSWIFAHAAGAQDAAANDSTKLLDSLVQKASLGLLLNDLSWWKIVALITLITAFAIVIGAIFMSRRNKSENEEKVEIPAVQAFPEFSLDEIRELSEEPEPREHSEVTISIMEENFSGFSDQKVDISPSSPTQEFSVDEIDEIPRESSTRGEIGEMPPLPEETAADETEAKSDITPIPLSQEYSINDTAEVVANNPAREDAEASMPVIDEYFTGEAEIKDEVAPAPLYQEQQPREIKKYAVASPPSHGAVINLMVIGGKLKSKMYTAFVSNSCIIGRNIVCDISVPEDDEISGRHCDMFFQEGQLFIRDLGSTNGTHINGARIDNLCALEDGDSMRLGKTEFRMTVLKVLP